ncbi:MAG: hypothetical protein SOX04_04525 [Eubacteriales bacterium]|nr:hypothetical protein [Clostridiales bacterium]MDY3241793.1 hypothetical protein [Eubacteriales bacterium]MDY6078881.1 hypothetical protein [Eubacteriales bacterium]
MEQTMSAKNKNVSKNKKNAQDLSPLYKKLSLGPEIRGEEPKGPYPRGRVKQVFDVFRAESSPLMRNNCWFLLFALPFFFVVYWCTNYFAGLAVSGFDFMGNIGMAYPGGADTLVQAQLAVYDAYQFVLYLLVPAIIVTSIGMAGAFSVVKSFMWGEKIEKVTKPFFRGVKKFWWKYLIVMTVNALLVLALGSTVIYFLKLRAVGAVTGGHWAMLIFVCIAEFLLLYVNMQLLPLLAEVDLPFFKQVKDALIFSIKLAPIGLPLFLICLVPVALLFINNAAILIVIIVLLMMVGLILYGLIFTAFSQWALDSVLTPLYIMEENKNSAVKNKNKKKKSDGVAVNPVKDEISPIQDKPVAVVNTKNHKNNKGGNGRKK